MPEAVNAATGGRFLPVCRCYRLLLSGVKTTVDVFGFSIHSWTVFLVAVENFQE
jgi:hypothetical protein